jgi:phosphoglycolate phosphatase
MSCSSAIRAVLFDFDYTLVDATEGNLECLNTALADDVDNHKPHPERLERAAGALRLAPAECLYVGDHAVDAEAAQRAGMPFAAVSTGFSEASVWQRFPTLAILQDPRGLPALLDALQER